MKKLLLFFLFNPLFLISQSLGFGIAIENSSQFGTAYKFSFDKVFYEDLNKSYVIGFEYGSSIWGADNMTGYIYFDEYPEDNTGKFIYNVKTPALKFGYEITNSFYLSITAGYNFSKEFGVFNASYSIGEYFVESGNKNNSAYYKIGIEFISSWFNPKIGYGSNGIYLGFSIITNNKNLKNYFTNRKKINQSKKIILGGKSINDVNLYDLRSMVEVFIKDCALNGIEIKKNKINSIFIDLPTGVVALAEGMNNDDEIIIKVDPSKWRNASASKKWYVLYHELGHDILNLEHGEGGKMMFNYVDRDYSWDEFSKDKEYMFESYKQLRNNN